MTIQALYKALGSDYTEVENRLSSAAMIERFALKFRKDETYALLCEALADGRMTDAFRAAHTLKGICGNLGFDRLYLASSVLAEKLRNGDFAGYEPLFDAVAAEYERAIHLLEEYEAAKS